MHGVKVTTLGAPFYSGWGLTDDRYSIPRRKRSLSVLEVFAAAIYCIQDIVVQIPYLKVIYHIQLIYYRKSCFATK